MKARVKVLGHAVHPMAVTAPIGLAVGTLALDALSATRPDEDGWPDAALALAGLTCATGLAAGAVGLVDWLGIPAGTRAKRIGVWHAASNVASLALLAASVAARATARDRRSPLGAALSTAGVAVMGLGGWLGGELVERLGISVDPGANPNAPSSLSRSEVFVPLQSRRRTEPRAEPSAEPRAEPTTEPIGGALAAAPVPARS